MFDITETKNGIVWAATEFGAAWYNGFYWQSISQKDGLPERIPSAIVSDGKDSLYVLISGQLYYGDLKGFGKIPIIMSGAEKKVTSIAFVNNELILTVDEKVFILQNNSVKPFTHSSIDIKNQKVFMVHQTRFSTWLNTSSGLYRWENNKWNLKLEAPSQSIAIKYLAEDCLGNGVASIIGPRSHYGIWEWTTNSNLTKNLKEGIENVLALDIGPEGNAIMAKEPEVVKVSQNRSWPSLQFIPPQLKNSHLLKFRNNGDLWVGTELGLYLHRVTSKRWEVWKFPQFDPKNNINEIIRTKDGSIWIATGNGIVIRKPNGTNQTIENIYHTKLGTLTGLIEDKKGHVWISSGLSFEGAFLWIKKDKKGNLWFLGISRKDFRYNNIDNDPGAYIYENGKFLHWGTKHGLINGRVYSFAEGLDGSFWFATGGGISRWKPDASISSPGTWKHWTEKEGLREDRIFVLTIDNKNKIWFGDQTFGIGSIEGDTIKYLTTSDGLISNAIWDIRIDEKNRIWIAARGGIGLFMNGTWFNIGLNDGLSNARIWPLLPLENKLYIGTSGGGVEILNFEDIQTTPPIVNILGPVTRGNTMYAHCKAFSFWGEQVSENIEIRYKIDNNEWTPWRRIRQIIEPNLSSGSHTLTIQSKGLLGNFRTDIKSVSFSIEPPLFLRPFFYVPLGALSLGLLVFGFIYFIGMSLKSISRDVKRGEEQIRQILQDRSSPVFETKHLKKNGDEIDILINASVIDYDGQQAILSLNRDITELKQAEATLRLLAQTVASAQDCVSITDLDGTILFVNDAFAQTHGYTPEELHSKNISIIHSPATPNEIADQIRLSTLEGGWYGEISHQRKDGTEFPVELWSSVVYDEQNKPVAIVGVARDISDRRRYEIDRERLIHELKEALSEVKMLTGLLPICSNCKKIRDDGGYWTQVETYIAKHTDATFTHGLCPDCIKELFPDVYKRMKENGTTF
ncbi:MAG: PAS domain S-box protein [Ignavibacteriales bacterium]|nr:PAS domain S-box protein [Ignavibacteriales bacterium]